MARKYKFIGHNIPRVDGVEKVTGRAKFTGDMVVSGMLHGKILRSPYPHARILSIDSSGAEVLPGVIAVLTARDISALDAPSRGGPPIAMGKPITRESRWPR